MNQRTVWRLNFTGWILFILSAMFFIWAAIRAGDLISLLASVLFLVACFVFLIPLWARRPAREN